ncbi:hypothetical protein K9M74_02600 [Candidatus Woesearchaeota archaeon]|nr:hypothetical protein [Candidatus Woesearchaeota archaeon]
MDFTKFIPGIKPYICNGKESEHYVILPDGSLSYKCLGLKPPTKPYCLFDDLNIPLENRFALSDEDYLLAFLDVAKSRDKVNGANIEAAMFAKPPSSKERLPAKSILDAHLGVLSSDFL